LKLSTFLLFWVEISATGAYIDKKKLTISTGPSRKVICKA
jgi:hypothetical protein